jgi:hypothetical protein
MGGLPPHPLGALPLQPRFGEGRTQEAEALSRWSVFVGSMKFNLNTSRPPVPLMGGRGKRSRPSRPPRVHPAHTLQ